MREIKFRAWIKKDKRMEHCIDVNPFYIGDCDRMHWKHEEVELMQYTGLKDKNGKEIYQGDIVKESNSKGIIAYEYCFFGIAWIANKDFYNNALKYHSSTIEVIGNIYENPDLLEE